MKVLPFKIPKPKDEALVYQVDRERVFYDQLHQHAEIQISYIAKGAGSLIVGDSISDYKEGDILVIGGYVPHAFKSDVSFSPNRLCTLFFLTSILLEKSFSALQTLHPQRNSSKNRNLECGSYPIKTSLLESSTN